MMGSDVVVHPEGISMHPVIDIIASNGIAGDGAGALLGQNQFPANSPVIPGYNHLDVLTAAAVQNDGQPEKVTTNLLNFIFP